jgi:hypothetical protein
VFLPLLEALMEVTFGDVYLWSLVVPEFLGQPGNNHLIAVISFLETKKKITQGQNQVSKEEGGPHPDFNSQNLLLLLIIGEQPECIL